MTFTAPRLPRPLEEDHVSQPGRRSWVALLIGSFLLAAAGASARPVNLVRTEVVSPVAGNPVASGARLLSAVADITAPSATNPWLVKIEPGVYDLDGQSLAMRPFVDVEGSGEGVTIVQSTVNSLGTMQGADHAELRGLTVLNTAATTAIALRSSAAGFAASHVTCVAQGGSGSSTGLANFADGGAFRDMTVRAEGGPVATGVSTDGGLLLRVRALASGSNFAYGVFSAASHGEITDVTGEAVGAGYATGFRNEGGGPRLRDVRAIGHGADISEGIVNGAGSAARIQGAVIEVAGGASFASGIRNEFSSASISDATISVATPSSAFGVTSSFSGTPALRNVTVRVTAGGNGVGVQSDQTQVSVEGSTISADGFSLRNAFGSTATSIRVGASRLEGAVQPAEGTLRCVASYDPAYAALGSGCTP
jgi:hypothetical protein